MLLDYESKWHSHFWLCRDAQVPPRRDAWATGKGAMAEEKEGTGFKVVDRRSFDADGSRRESSPAEKAGPAAHLPPPRSSSAVPAADAPEETFEEGTPTFETLVSYLSTTALFQLGLLAGPSGERIPSDLVNARRTLDLLEILQQKTRGNLTPEETKLLEDVLYELRINFVEVSKRPQRKGK